MERYIAKCKSCGGVYTSALTQGQDARKREPKPGVVYTHPRTGDLVINCRQCNGARVAKPVSGRFSAEHVCNEKCVTSHGFVCSCSCGGMNHGAAHAAAGAAS